jgi:hypothetical protein
MEEKRGEKQSLTVEEMAAMGGKARAKKDDEKAPEGNRVEGAMGRQRRGEGGGVK